MSYLYFLRNFKLGKKIMFDAEGQQFVSSKVSQIWKQENF